MSGFEKRSGHADAIEVYAYQELPHSILPDWEAWGGGACWDVPQDGSGAAEGAVADSIPPDLEKRLAEESSRAFDAGKAQGVEQGRAAERALQSPMQQRIADQLERLAAVFAQQREQYLAAVEPEVVKLALAVAARILRREAQMDPLLLTGAVRVALGQLASSTSVRLRVPAAELDIWKESVALLPNLPVKPQVIPGEGMRLGDCLVETEIGSVDLGVRAQLSEIERGFFDRANSAASPPELALAGGGMRP